MELFYGSCNFVTKPVVDQVCGGSFMSKTFAESSAILDKEKNVESETKKHTKSGVNNTVLVDDDKIKELVVEPKLTDKVKVKYQSDAEVVQPSPPICKLPSPFPQRFKNKVEDDKFLKFIIMLKELFVNILLVKALEQMPDYAKFMKDLVAKKKTDTFEPVDNLNHCSANSTSLVYCVPKKRGMTVVANDKNELVPKASHGCRVYTDYRKVNKSTLKDHFPMPFMDHMLGHKISEKGLEVDKVKIEVIEKFPSPISVKGIRSFLGHAGFYMHFIKDFSKIAHPLCNLLEKEVKFYFDEACMKAFECLKVKLISAPVIIALDWSKLFEVMSDASGVALGVVLG
ncbi:uncharacterized protein LOC129903644 [Solanum dulcamara]|uniref:uncharacterized protein LOC129903644 n=1 Tax=Solanum dulcamara TaxID=45834 RepID=UPI002485AFA3|nr:uncharacterized protein LOC129903644 [Solanum dulcamara]